MWSWKNLFDNGFGEKKKKRKIQQAKNEKTNFKKEIKIKIYSHSKTLNFIKCEIRVTMSNDENLPVQCHPVIKSKKKKIEKENETV